MIRNGEIAFADIQRILRRYGWILAITVFVGLGAALLAASILPKRYTSQTQILVDQPVINRDLLPGLASDTAAQKLSSMQEQILSRSRLQPIIEKFGLFERERKKVPMDQVVEKLRSAITVTPMEPMAGTQRQLPGFIVAVTLDNPQIAQQVCNSITTMFISQSIENSGKSAERQTDFFSGQVEEAKRKLDEKDAELAAFKRQHLGALPDDDKTTLNLLMTTNSQLDSNTQQLSRAQQEKAVTESLLAGQVANWKATQTTGGNPETLDTQLANLQDQLTALQSRYTADHPDVIKTKNQIEELKRRMADAGRTEKPVTTTASTTEPPQIQQLRAKLRQSEISIADLTKQQVRIQNQIQSLTAKIQASPVVEQQYKDIMRDYQTAQDFYNDLLKKRAQSQVVTDLTQQQGGEQFRVLDPPSLPSTPSFPKKLYFAGGGFGGGLALGLGILYLLAMKDKSLYTERDVEVCLKLPVLALVPVMESSGHGNLHSPKIRGTLDAPAN